MNLERLIGMVEQGDDLRKLILAELRSMYDTEIEEGVTCPHEGETTLLESICSEEVLFDDCSLTELMDVIEMLRKWNEVFNP